MKTLTAEEKTVKKTARRPQKGRVRLKRLLFVLLALALLVGLGALVSFLGNRSNLKKLTRFAPVDYGADRLLPETDAFGNVSFTADRPLKIVQLTDVHIGGGWMSLKKDAMALNCVAAMLTAEKPDLVIVTGDIAYPIPFQSGTLNNRPPAELFASLMERLGVYWTLTFGNHDTESYSYYTREEIGALYESKAFPHCLFRAGNADADGVGNQIVSVVSQFVSNFQAAFRPQIVKYYVLKDCAELSKLTIRASRLSAYLILILMVPICFEIKDFLSIWLGNYPKYAVEFCLLTLVCVYFESICNPLITLITSDKDIRKYQITVSLIYATNLIFCWLVLVGHAAPYLVIAVRLGIDLVLIASRLLLMRGQWYDFPIAEWVKKAIVKPLLVMTIPVGLSFLVQMIPVGSVWLRLFLFSGFSFVVCALSIYLLLLEKAEKDFIWKSIPHLH